MRDSEKRTTRNGHTVGRPRRVLEKTRHPYRLRMMSDRDAAESHGNRKARLGPRLTGKRARTAPLKSERPQRGESAPTGEEPNAPFRRVRMRHVKPGGRTPAPANPYSATTMPMEGEHSAPRSPAGLPRVVSGDEPGENPPPENFHAPGQAALHSCGGLESGVIVVTFSSESGRVPTRSFPHKIRPRKSVRHKRARQPRPICPSGSPPCTAE